MAGDRIVTPWAAQIDPAQVHQEYPRPAMVRDRWLNLNGLWEYAITSAGAAEPQEWQGKILVPFAVQSALSGVGAMVSHEQALWYRRTVPLPTGYRDHSLLLHFGAVDWQCDVWVNGQKAGAHQGGYDPFSFEISDLVRTSGDIELVIRVWDPTDEGPQPRGKQVNTPRGIWYTPVTGIWQTVWLEPVPRTHISELQWRGDIDQGHVWVMPTVRGAAAADQVRVTILSAGTEVSSHTATAGSGLILPLSDFRLWSPDDPFLYDLKVALIRGGQVTDQVDSYFAMRKISMKPDKYGVQRMLLNNEFLFHFGPLDQGWWPDGLYTAPSDEALMFDIVKTKEMGFNMIRKHVKMEPARWYYHCDRLGILVWQDMPSGDMGNRWETRPGVIGRGTDKDRTPESENIYKTEWQAIINALRHFPCIVVWVPFNEAWGQFKTREIVDWTIMYDPDRLVNSASGGNFDFSGHILDIHNYPEPCIPDPDRFGKDQILVLGEYGGLGLPVEGHTWQDKDNWGYQSFANANELWMRYETFIHALVPFVRMGLSAAIYTQTTDVEVEVNGLMTYDRKIIKMPEARLKDTHMALYSRQLVDMP